MTCCVVLSWWSLSVSLPGEVGDWNNHFTQEQSRVFDEDYEKQMKGSNIPFRTRI